MSVSNGLLAPTARAPSKVIEKEASTAIVSRELPDEILAEVVGRTRMDVSHRRLGASISVVVVAQILHRGS